MTKTLIAPSILSADFACMGSQIEAVASAGADLIHCDVMDGVFVPNITFGIKMIADIKKRTELPLDVHLMIVEPQKYIERFMDAGADYLSVHYEACEPLYKTLETIKKRGVKAGVVIKPDTKVSVIKDFLQVCDFILLMSVYPGFGGQKFISGSLERLKELSSLAKAVNPEILIEIDGGVDFSNCESIVNAGADILVAGSAVFSSNDMSAAIEKLRIKK